MAAGKVHLELLEQYRRLYLKARALSLAQVCASGSAMQVGGAQETMAVARWDADSQVRCRPAATCRPATTCASCNFPALLPLFCLVPLPLQRARLYALDELEQCTMRIKWVLGSGCWAAGAGCRLGERQSEST